MNIPADLPSPDQENVYYSVKALITEFSKYFQQSKIKELEPILDNYYYPTFVFDTSNAPNSFQLTIHPKNSPKESFLMDGTGSIILENALETPIIEPPETDELDDNGTNVELDPSFYSSPKLKHSDFLTGLQVDPSTLTGVDLILGTKFWIDSGHIRERLQFLEINRNIVASSIKSLPKEEREMLKSEFDKIDAEISEIQNILYRIEIGKSQSFDGLQWEKAFTTNYFHSEYQKALLKENGVGGIEATGVNLLQSGIDLISYSVGTAGGANRKGMTKFGPPMDQVGRSIASAPTDDSIGLSKVYQDFIRRSFEPVNTTGARNQGQSGTVASFSPLLSESDMDRLAQRIGGGFLGMTDPLIGLLRPLMTFKNESIFVDSGNEGWLADWYYENFSNKILGEDVSFKGLDDYLNEFKTLSSAIHETANLNALGGERLLVFQAICKSILKLCQSNIDVSEFQPGMNVGSTDGTPIYEAMQRSPVLGPSGCHQFPSKASQPAPSEDGGGPEYSISSFTKPGFLCFAALDAMFGYIRNMHATGGSRSYINRNLKHYYSDHDLTISLMYDMGFTNIAQTQTSRVVDGKFTWTTNKQSMKYYMGGYYFNEERTESVPFCIPAGDFRGAQDERAFFNFNIPPVVCVNEVFKNDSRYNDEDIEGIRFVGDDHPNMVEPEYGYYMKGEDKVTYNQAWLNMGFNETDYWVKRTKRVHYGVVDPAFMATDYNGIPASSANSFAYWKHKNYNFPYFWSSVVSINRALVIEAYRYLAESIAEITGKDIDLSDDYILENFDLVSMYNSILQVFRLLRIENDNALSLFPDANGQFVVYNNNVEKAFTHRIWNLDYRNTCGLQTTKLVKDYIKFVSLCSNKKSLKIEDDHEPIEFDSSAYVPPEVIAVDTNSNFKNGHGGFGAYIPNEFTVYYDPLVCTKDELKKSEPIKKNMTAIGSYNVFNEIYVGYMRDTRILRSHSFMHDHIVKSFEEFRNYINGFEIKESVQSVFKDGHFDAQKDIRNPDVLVRQISSNRTLYRPDSSGIGGKYRNVKFSSDRMNMALNDILYVYVLGLKKELWAGGNFLTIMPEYYGTGDGILIPKAKKRFPLFRTPAIPNQKTDESMSAWILDYLHLSRGIRIDETTFSKKKELVYEPHVIESESGVFPWVKDDFEEGKPKKLIDPIFNLSPLVFPRNYFYDVCLENEFQRVVGVAIRKSDLNGLPIETTSRVQSIEDIIGSIRWVVV